MQEHHPSLDQLNLYDKRALGPNQFLAVHRHVTDCPKCSELCSSPSQEKDLTNLISALLPSEKDQPYHLTESELVNYVEGDGDDVSRELAESHLDVCDECSQALEKLHAPKVAVPIQPFVTASARPSRIIAFALLAIGVVLIALLFWATRPQSSQPINQIAGGDPKTGTGDATPSPGPATTASPNIVSTPPDDGPANADVLKSEEISPALRKAIKSAWTNQRLDTPAVLAELKGVQGRVLGDSSDGVPFQLVSPVGSVIQSHTPRFTWKPLAGAIAYEVVIADDKLSEVANSGRLSATGWTVPVALKPGRTYSWQVTAFKDGQRIISPALPAPQARFKILEKSRDDELRHLRQAFPDYHLGLGVFYTQVGMLDEAEQEFQALLNENPRSVTAAKLLGSVRSMKR